jgi:signal transduction histidine kinase
MFRSATFKLTVWYMALIVLVSIVFSTVVYNMAIAQLEAGLSHQSARLSNEFPAFSSNPQFRLPNELVHGRREIIVDLAMLNAFVFVCAGFASYGLARRTLTPIEQAHDQQQRFTADVSHELRTPLTAMRMSSEVALLDTKASKTELRQALTSNIEEADRMQLLVNNLLRLTKLESEELVNSFTAVSLGKVVQAALNQTDEAARTKHVKRQWKSHDFIVRADHASLVQMVVILLDNATKYSPAKSSVELITRREEGEAVLEIRDHGNGIDPQALAHVFERFYRADKSRASGTHQGFGLGLSIAKYIADLHRGSITLKSRAGHGTTAIVRIPLER